MGYDMDKYAFVKDENTGETRLVAQGHEKEFSKSKKHGFGKEHMERNPFDHTYHHGDDMMSESSTETEEEYNAQ